VTSGTFLQTRERLIHDVEAGMRDEGFIPILDLIPQFTREYDADTETFSFTLSVYGTHVGEENSWQQAGMMNGRLVEKYSQPVK
jgi:hypothetical protein